MLGLRPRCARQGKTHFFRVMNEHVSTAEQRARIRRATWTGGVARSFAEMEDIDLTFWLSVTPAERMLAMWSLVEDSLSLKGHGGPPPRLQRSVGGARPLRR